MQLSPNRRIVLNIAATYGRSLFGMFCAIVTGGWTFMALGEIDFGLYGLVGGLTAFVSFFNCVLAGSVGRFYAYSAGEAQANPEVGIENGCRWFNTAVIIHSTLPCVLLAIGYPIGVYAIEHWLTVPADRVNACVWIWRFTCLSCFVGMVSVPFNAMYTAKQYITELTIYSFAGTIANLLFVIYMHYHPGDWFLTYGAAQCLLAILPQMIISLRAYMVFPECRFVRVYMFSREHLCKIFSFSFFQGLGSLCGLLRTQGLSVVANINFGPAINASMSISNSIVGHTSSLSGSMTGAFYPAITNACGAGDLDKMRRMAFQLSKIGTLLLLFFALPIMLELPKILELWLKNPPPYTYGLCLLALGICFANSISVGQMTAVNASGKIKAYHVFLSAISIFTLPMAWLGVELGGNVCVMQAILLLMIVLNTLGRVYFAGLHASMSASYWYFNILIPILGVTVGTGIIGYLPHFFMDSTVARVFVTFLFTELSFVGMTWFFLLEGGERAFIIGQIKKFKSRFMERKA